MISKMAKVKDLGTIIKEATGIFFDLETLIKNKLGNVKIVSSAISFDDECRKIFLLPFQEYDGRTNLNKTQNQLGIQYNIFNNHLASLALTYQSEVGFYDGYLKQFIATPTYRLASSAKYARGVEVGEDIGLKVIGKIY